MKKIILAACIALLCVACGYKSVETPLGEDIVRYTAKINDQIVVGARMGEDVLVPPELGYTDIQLKYDHYLLAYKQGLWNLYSTSGEALANGMSFEQVLFGKGGEYFTLVKNSEKYLLLSNVFIGPFTEIDYRINEKIVFAKISENWLAYDATTGLTMMDGAYTQIIRVENAKGVQAWYVCDPKGFHKVVDRKPVVSALSSWSLKNAQKEAAANDTPWPENGCGFVKVKNLP